MCGGYLVPVGPRAGSAPGAPEVPLLASAPVGPVLLGPLLPVLLEPPLVPVEACSRRHFMRSSPVSVSHRPLPAAPLVPTLVEPVELVVPEERGAVVLAEPAVSALVPVDGEALSLVLPLMPEPEPILEPDCVCANAALESASSAAAVAAQRDFSSMVLLL
jgi:hypothetical protein